MRRDPGPTRSLSEISAHGHTPSSEGLQLSARMSGTVTRYACVLLDRGPGKPSISATIDRPVGFRAISAPERSQPAASRKTPIRRGPRPSVSHQLKRS